MKPFPTSFAKIAEMLGPLDSHPMAVNDAINALADKGFGIQLGMTRKDTPALQLLSMQDSIRKYCPKDCTERFKDEQTIEHWLKKERLVFLLKQNDSGELAGIAWTGPGTSPRISDGKLTGGVRLSENFQGLGLATPFLAIVLGYTNHSYSSEILWFECWESNAGALHIYQKLGFQIVQTEPAPRPTPAGTTEPDTRVYMKLG